MTLGQSDDGGATWTVVDQGHLAENTVLADSFERAIAALDLDLSPHDDKELVALFALPEDRKLLFAKKRVGSSRRTRRLKSTSLSDISPACASRRARTPSPAFYPIRLYPGFHCSPSDNVERPLRTVRSGATFR